LEKLKLLRHKCHLRRGTAYISMGLYMEAVADFKSALYYNPTNVEIAYDLVKVQRLQEADQYKKEGDTLAANATKETNREENRKAAIEKYSLAIKTQPSYFAAYSNRAALYLVQGLYEKCIEDCNMALEIISTCILMMMTFLMERIIILTP